MSTDEQTEFNKTLTRAHNRLRNLHECEEWNRPARVTVRDHQLVVENPDGDHPQAYELQTADGETLGSIELDHFQHPDDLVRFVDSAIQVDFETAEEWASEEPTIGWEGER